MTLDVGVVDPLLREWLTTPTCIKVAFTSLFVPYNMLFLHLSGPDAVIGIFNLMMSYWTLGMENFAMHLGDEFRQLGHALVRSSPRGTVKLSLLRARSVANIAGEVSIV